MAVKDYLIDDSGDLKFENGDLATGFSDPIHQEDIIISDIGNWKEFPTLGVGVNRYLNGPNIQALKKYVKLHLESDDYKVRAVDVIDNKEIKPDAIRV